MNDVSNVENPSETLRHSEIEKPKMEIKQTRLRTKANLVKIEPSKSSISNLSSLNSSKPATVNPG